ncbi:MAG: cupin domain-containing protein [Halieaceae bacterium]|nr:cupin domain-containing protein [Halieaceae bacterium]MCP5167654.1 cupin domain-containing protein [Pseudomonadales bacterium]MCP5187440.1 cupin domain-containing protein [Pseudomonadales bacterium]
MSEQGEIKVYQPGREYFFEEGCFINELSNDSGDPAVSIARARVEPGKLTRWHYLRGTTERYVIVSGTGVVETGELPGTQVSTGDVVSIPPGVRQRIRSVGKDELVFLAICTPRFQQENYVDCDDGE